MEKIKKFFKKYTKEIIFVGVIILLLLLNTCSHNQQLKAEGRKVELEKQLSKLKDSIKVVENNRAIEKDSLDKDTAKKQAVIDSLVQKDIKNKQRITDLKKDLSKKREEVSNYNSQQVTVFTNERYNTNTTVATDTSVVIPTSTGVKMVTELVEKDACIEEVKIKDNQLVDKDKVIEETNGQLQNKTVELSSAEGSIKLLKEAQAKSDEIHKVDNVIIRKLKVGNTIKWILIPAAFAAGVLIAK